MYQGRPCTGQSPACPVSCVRGPKKIATSGKPILTTLSPKWISARNQKFLFFLTLRHGGRLTGQSAAARKRRRHAVRDGGAQGKLSNYYHSSTVYCAIIVSIASREDGKSVPVLASSARLSGPSWRCASWPRHRRIMACTMQQSQSVLATNTGRNRSSWSEAGIAMQLHSTGFRRRDRGAEVTPTSHVPGLRHVNVSLQNV